MHWKTDLSQCPQAVVLDAMRYHWFLLKLKPRLRLALADELPKISARLNWPRCSLKIYRRHVSCLNSRHLSCRKSRHLPCLSSSHLPCLRIKDLPRPSSRRLSCLISSPVSAAATSPVSTADGSWRTSRHLSCLSNRNSPSPKIMGQFDIHRRNMHMSTNQQARHMPKTWLQRI